jgi:hypothetical protein
MRKRKVNIDARPAQDVPETEALETEREQRYEEVNGETSTEGVGMGYTGGDPIEDVTTGDGPVAGESIEPPVPKRTGRRQTKAQKVKKQRERWAEKGNHTAARSSKKI